jgi:cell division protein FtsW
MKSLLSGDRPFLVIVLILALGGLAVFSSASLGLLARQGGSIAHIAISQIIFGLGAGTVALALTRLTPLRAIKKAAPYFYGFTIFLTLLVFVPHLGVHTNGATRWINLGFTTIQPAEFLKFGVVLMIGWWISTHSRELKDYRKGLLPFMAIVGLPAVVLLMQPNTSTTALVLATSGIMYFAAGAPWRDFAILAGTAILAIALILFMRPYAMKRVMTFIHPSADSLGSGYQIQQSLIAIGSGQVTGRGFGQSVQKFNYLPEPNGDSVFAVYGEEFGFIGSLILILLFALFAARGIVIAGQSKDLFGGLVALGFSWLIAFQAFVNMSAMLGIVPLTGLPLPFVSQGGTALMMALAAAGLILNIAAHKTSRV